MSVINLKIIRDLAKKKNIMLKDLATQVGITNAGLQRMLNENTTKIETLEKISEVLEVPIVLFFQNENEIDLETSEQVVKLKKEVEDLKKENAKLEEQLDDKRTIIEVLRSKGVISGYNLFMSTLSEEEREKEKAKILDINNPLIDNRPFDFKDQNEVWEFINKLIESKKPKK